MVPVDSVIAGGPVGIVPPIFIFPEPLKAITKPVVQVLVQDILPETVKVPEVILITSLRDEVVAAIDSDPAVTVPALTFKVQSSPLDGRTMVIAPETVSELVPLIVSVELVVLIAAKVTEVATAAVSTVTVCPWAITTESEESGTRPQLQVPVVFQFPVPFEVQVASEAICHSRFSMKSPICRGPRK